MHCIIDLGTKIHDFSCFLLYLKPSQTGEGIYCLVIEEWILRSFTYKCI